MHKLAAIITLLVVAAAALLFFGSFENRTKACLDDPEPGDVYMVRISELRPGPRMEPRYGLVRVEEVYGNQIVAHPSVDSSPNKRRAYRYLEGMAGGGIRFDMSQNIAIARADLLTLHERGVILVARSLRS